jgi:hypothetical protein
LASRDNKIGLHGSVPPWFAGLLPEGALRELVFTELGPGDHDQFDCIDHPRPVEEHDQRTPCRLGLV